jgi:hypothetical protein
MMAQFMTLIESEMKTLKLNYISTNTPVQYIQ